jgi:Xaa-Pro aminopeptidase
MTQCGSLRWRNAVMDIHSERVRRVVARMQPDSILVLPAAPARIRNRDTHFPYRSESDILYLTGVNEEGLSIMLTPNELHIFAQTRDPERERWVGRVRGHDFFLQLFASLATIGLEVHLHPVAELEAAFRKLISGKHSVYYDFGAKTDLDVKFLGILNEELLNARRGTVYPRALVRASELLHECRLFKDEFDLRCMRKAAEVSAAAHNAVRERIESTTATVSEFEIKALIEHEFMRGGCDRLAYPSIVAAGNNATILHYEGTAGLAQQGEFILIDAGAEFEGYAADITRTTSVGGRSKCSALQRDLYDIVLAAQRAAIAEAKPGTSVANVHDAAVQVLSRGLFDLGLFASLPVDGDNQPARAESLEDVLEKHHYRHFYMHRTSHYLGLDVHDVGDYYRAGESRLLEPGMVITVEPGLYFPAEYDFLEPEVRGIGIRIEDDILITKAGNDVLTVSCVS